MSVVNEANKVFYQGNGSIVDFNFGFRVLVNGDLKVVLVNDDLTFSELSLGGDFTVALNANNQGGVITATVAPLATQKILIYRETPKEQTGEFTKFGFDPRAVETRLDVLTIITQDVQEQVDRSMKTSVAVETFDSTLPADLEAGDIVAVNLTANGFIKGINTSQIVDLEAKTDAIDQAVLDSQAAQTASEAAQTAAELAETNAQTSETNAATSAQTALDAAQSSQWREVEYLTFADSPRTLTAADAGIFFSVDASAGNFVFNLPQISTLDLSGARPFFGGKKSDATVNSVTVNSVGGDEIDSNGTSIISNVQNNGYKFIPDIDLTPDSWATIAIATASGATNPTLIEGTGGRVVTENADMDGSGALSASGQFQVQNLSGDGLMQVAGDVVIYSDLMTKVIEETNVVYSVGNNWLFNSKLSHRDRIAKVTMMNSDPTKEISLFTGSSTGYVMTIFFGDHVNHQAPFKVVCPGTGIVGHAAGIEMTRPGQAIMLRQIGTSEYVVEAANFDLEQTPKTLDIGPSFDNGLDGWTFVAASGAVGSAMALNTTDPITGIADLQVTSNADRSIYAVETITNLSDLTEFDSLRRNFSTKHFVEKGQNILINNNIFFDEDKGGHAQVYVGLFRTDTGALVEYYNLDGASGDVDTNVPLRPTPLGNAFITDSMINATHIFDTSSIPTITEFTLAVFTAEGDPLSESSGSSIVYRISRPNITTENIERVGNNEKVFMSRTNTATYVCANNAATLATFNVKVEDTHSAWDSATSSFVAPRSGLYAIDAQATINSASSSDGNLNYLIAQVDSGTGFTEVARGQLMESIATSNRFGPCPFHRSVRLKKGDKLRLLVFHNWGGSRSTQSSAPVYNYFMATEV